MIIIKILDKINIIQILQSILLKIKNKGNPK